MPLEELVAIKGNREPQYTTPVSLAKLKQITPTSIAFMELMTIIYLSLDSSFIYLIMVGIQFSYFPPLHHFLFVNMTDGGLSHEGQLDFIFLKRIICV